MNSISPKLQERFEEVGSQQDNPDPLVIAKLIDQGSPAILYATEYDPFDGFYGYLTGSPKLKGWVNIPESDMEPLDFPKCGGIKIDSHFKEIPISQAVPELNPAIQQAKLDQIRDQTSRKKDHDPER